LRGKIAWRYRIIKIGELLKRKQKDTWKKRSISKSKFKIFKRLFGKIYRTRRVKFKIH